MGLRARARRYCEAEPRHAEHFKPKAALTELGATFYEWDLATDALVFGSNARDVLGADFFTAANFVEAFQPQSGSSAIDAILASEGHDAGAGVGYRTRYAIRGRGGRAILVEDCGRWYAGPDGQPAFACGTLLTGIRAVAALDPALLAREALLSRLAMHVAQTHHSRHAVTLIVGSTGVSVVGDPAELVRHLRPMLRAGDLFVPYSPDRFALLLASCGAEQAAFAIERASKLLPAGIRLGAASAPDEATTASELLRRAERTLVEIAGSATSADVVLRILNSRTLSLHLQPVRDARSGALTFQRALPQVITPAGNRCVAALSTLAEGADLSVLVDARMVELAADYLARNPNERLALTVSPATLGDPAWLPLLAAYLGARPGIESRLLVCIRESAALREATSLRASLNAMKALGVGLCLEGFGVGQLSSRHLRHLPFDLAAIDPRVTGTLGATPDGRLYLRSLIDLAQSAGLATVADAGNDPAAAERLAHWGVDFLEASQGIPKQLGARLKRA